MFLKNINISSKIKRSKVTDYAALTSVLKAFPGKLDIKSHSTMDQSHHLYHRDLKLWRLSDVALER